ncbi:MAG: hypothetical protein IJM63_02270 [Solobacterium sp.]|nr:hypothetical protein [Solobacterium sp.]MBQ9823295.1 hypothetical protein [Solobacterium sp.]
MKPEDFTPYLTKFIAVRLDDGTMDAGYIANPGDFRDFPDDNMRVRLINGLLQTEIEISRIRSITLPPREDTTKIPILGFDEPISTVQTMDRTEELNIEDKLDQLVERNLFEFPDLDELLNNDRK